ncbi:diguanylate cyclase [Ilumatobacter sp.]|uniref:diguanylate cyclase n=1 Tax=Ilumatobacter sp. TaxID=1967498 RepID=UPI003B523AF7
MEVETGCALDGGPPDAAVVEIDAIPVATAAVDPDGTIVAVNPRFAQLSTLAVGGRIDGIVARGRRDEVRALLHRGDGTTTVPLDGPVHLVGPAEVTVARSAAPRAIVVFVVPLPLGDSAVAELIDRARAHDLHDQGVVVGDGSRIVHVNATAAAIYGRPAHELLEMGSLFSLFPLDERRRIDDLVAEARAAGVAIPDRFETFVDRPDGSRLAVDIWVKATLSADGGARTYTLISDATARREQERRLTAMAHHDPLTGLANRHLLVERMTSARSRIATGADAGALCFIDLDGFKDVNDDLGHGVGDEVLVEIASRLRSHVRPCDTVARVGGDEFVVLVEGAESAGDLATLGERLRSVVRQPVERDGWTVTVDASIGAIALDDPDADVRELLDRADRSMYEQKRSRRAGTPPLRVAG